MLEHGAFRKKNAHIQRKCLQPNKGTMGIAKETHGNMQNCTQLIFSADFREQEISQRRFKPNYLAI